MEQLHPSEGISLYPPPSSVEGKDLGPVSRRPVPVDELFGFLEDAARQLSL